MIRIFPATISIFDTPTEYAIIVPVNTVGVAGAGLAKAAAQRYPLWAKDYKTAFEGKFTAGAVVLHVIRSCPRRYWVSFATKTHWQEKSSLSAIREGLDNLVLKLTFSPSWNGVPLAVPALGCGLGGLAWDQVYPLLVSALSPLDRDVIIFP